MTRKPKIWFDYEYLASLDDPDAPREAFFLDEPAQQVLSQLAEMVLWDTRWFNGDQADSEALAHSIYEQLKMPLHFDDLIPYLDDVENLLQAILDHSDNSVIVDQLCCDNGVIAPLPDETGQDVVRDVGDPPNGIADWPTYDVHLCSSAQKFVDSLPGYITILQGLSILTTVGLAAAIAGLASGLAAAGIAATAVLGIQGALSFLESVRDLINIGPSWDDARTALEDSATKQDLVCAIVLSDTAQEAEDAIDAYLNGINSDAAASVRTLPLRFLMGQIFGAQADAGGYGGPCNCTVTPDEDFTFTFPSSFQGWSNYRGVWESPGRCRLNATNQASYMRLAYDTFATLAGFSGNSYALAVFTADIVDSVTFPGGLSGTYSCRVRVYYQDGTWDDTIISTPTVGAEINVDDSKLVKNGGDWIDISHLSGGDTTDKSMQVDNVYIGVIAI